MAKDAKGHGSEARSGHEHAIAVDTVKNPLKGLFLGGPNAEQSESKLRGRFGYSDKEISGLKGGGDPRYDGIKANMDAAATLASGAKSAPVDVHPSMKMSSGDFASLSAAVKPHLASTADPAHSPMRQRWDAMNKSGFNTSPLYKAGLNDNHIDTALRKIQGK